MTTDDANRLTGLLRRTLRESGRVHADAAELMTRQHPTLIKGSVDAFGELMDDLHRGLVVKIYVTIVRADDRWTGPEKRVAAAMIEYLWGQELRGKELRDAAGQLFTQADSLGWNSLMAPYVRYRPLWDFRAAVETNSMRLANLVAKCDGTLQPQEADALRDVAQTLQSSLYPKSSESGSSISGSDSADGRGAAGPDRTHAAPHHSASSAGQGGSAGEDEDAADPEVRRRRLNEAMDELDGLVGLSAVKTHVRSYANFLKLQTARQQSGKPVMPMSMHMAFTGNPGTGKTTVARIVARILGAMGTLSGGHLVETDRSGLVAEYAGQTATKTNALCDQARGGVLFIDEAYSLISSGDGGDDAYGREALGTLLKRMEDDRADLVVILAGYSDEMRTMIRSNPGLSSRINQSIHFDDYDPPTLGHIYQTLCEHNHYDLPADARHRLLLGFQKVHSQRDRHFGNGRLVRNSFERSVRRLADRVADIPVLTEELLGQLSATDVTVAGVAEAELDGLVRRTHQLRIDCSGCGRSLRISAASLGGAVRCSKCNRQQSADWAQVHFEEQTGPDADAAT